MQTLADLVRSSCPLPDASATTGSWPRPAKPKAKLRVSGEGSITLPGDVVGLQRVDGQGNGVASLAAEDARNARALLIYAPSIVIPLRSPSNLDLSAFELDPTVFRHENPRAVATAVAIEPRHGQVLYGTSRLVVLENGLRMGSTLVLENADHWTDSLDEAEAQLLSKCQPLSESFAIGPEPGQKPWPTVVALLGGSDKPGELPAGWKRTFRFAAALRQVNLDIRPSPDSSRQHVLHDLRTRPPDGLLVWAEWVPVPDLYLSPFRSARPQAYAQVLGVPSRGEMTFDDHLAELQMHLREVSPMEQEELRQDENRAYGWDQAAADIRALEGQHFALTERARSMLAGNLYPQPRRMAQFTTKLAVIAQEFRSGQGRLGERLSDYAINNHGIEIALFDSSLSAPVFEYDGTEFQAEPHVKVDDAKSPDQVGRIYFAIDNANLRFIVDHIGLHDYS